MGRKTAILLIAHAATCPQDHVFTDLPCSGGDDYVLCAQLIIHVIDTVLLFSDLTNGEVTTEVPVPAPLLDEAFAIAAGYELVPVVAPAASSTRRLLSTQ